MERSERGEVSGESIICLVLGLTWSRGCLGGLLRDGRKSARQRLYFGGGDHLYNAVQEA